LADAARTAIMIASREFVGIESALRSGGTRSTRVVDELVRAIGNSFESALGSNDSFAQRSRSAA
jgi:hypothetical protein